MGRFDEIRQSLVSGHEGKVQDLVLDLGAAVLVVLGWLAKKYLSVADHRELKFIPSCLR